MKASPIDNVDRPPNLPACGGRRARWALWPTASPRRDGKGGGGAARMAVHGGARRRKGERGRAGERRLEGQSRTALIYRGKIGERGGARTRGHRIKSPMLYQLSYPSPCRGRNDVRPAESWRQQPSMIANRRALNQLCKGSARDSLLEMGAVRSSSAPLQRQFLTDHRRRRGFV